MEAKRFVASPGKPVILFALIFGGAVVVFSMVMLIQLTLDNPDTMPTLVFSMLTTDFFFLLPAIMLLEKRNLFCKNWQAQVSPALEMQLEKDFLTATTTCYDGLKYSSQWLYLKGSGRVFEISRIRRISKERHFRHRTSLIIFYGDEPAITVQLSPFISDSKVDQLMHGLSSVFKSYKRSKLD